MLFFMSAFRQYLFPEYQNLVTTSEKKVTLYKQSSQTTDFLTLPLQNLRTARLPLLSTHKSRRSIWVNTSLKLHSNIINNHVFISYVHITLKHLFLLIVISLNFGIHTRYLKIIFNHFSYLSLCIINSIYSSLQQQQYGDKIKLKKKSKFS